MSLKPLNEFVKELINLEEDWWNSFPIDYENTSEKEIRSEILSFIELHPHFIVKIGLYLVDFHLLHFLADKHQFWFETNCNDFFAYACADGVPISLVDLYKVFIMYIIGDKHATDRFSVEKRQQLPLEKYIIKMKEFDETLSEEVKNYKPTTLYKAYLDGLIKKEFYNATV